MEQPRTLYDKLIDSHTVRRLDDRGHVLLYIDRQVLNEYTSPQAFTALRLAGRKVWRPQASLAVVDPVNPPTPIRTIKITADPGAARQVSYLAENCRDFGIELFDVLDKRQGIEHVVMPEQGMILPGMVIGAGDSHTTTYGAFGSLGFGIGTSEIEHLLATGTLVYRRLKTMLVTFGGKIPTGVTAKDLIMQLIKSIGASGATGYALELTGPAIAALSVEGRMTVCNMAVEAGARGAIMAPDQKIFDYVKDKPRAPKGELWEQALESWRLLASHPRAVFDREVFIDAGALQPMVTWGTSPDQAVGIGDDVPDPADERDASRRRDLERALSYMGLLPGTPMHTVPIDRAFIGSCTNARIEDLRSAAGIVKGHKVANGVRAMVVPGSTAVHDEAEAEGLHQIFLDAGFEWRQSGCSMCLAMNDDYLLPGERCASSTNRNFEGRQGAGGRTHLMSPAMVAAAAITGHLTDVRTFANSPV